MPHLPKAADDTVADCPDADVVRNDDKQKAAQDKSYYYDDTHGYEDYDPEDDGNGEED